MIIINKIKEKISSQWIFFIVVAMIYLIMAMINFALFESAIFAFIMIAKKIIPVLVLVFVLIFFSNLFLNPKKISKLVGESAGIKGWIGSIIGGILSTGPIYMWYPLLNDLKDKGMENSFIATFLYSRAIKIPIMPMMIYYFGFNFTIILCFYMILFSIINGVFVEKLLAFKK